MGSLEQHTCIYNTQYIYLLTRQYHWLLRTLHVQYIYIVQRMHQAIQIYGIRDLKPSWNYQIYM